MDSLEDIQENDKIEIEEEKWLAKMPLALRLLATSYFIETCNRNIMHYFLKIQKNIDKSLKMKRFRFWSNASKVEDLKNSEQGYFPADKVKEEGKFFGIKSYLNNFYLTSGWC
ncbi:hypothetical protein Mgra_00000337 [Meloidogyne graminicola]|uniref:Uncharacterized protein n=1 Tax=Meloidogyne graminicola TaxID=189291 RepID=A0A8T0A300_9BILA|nr:hypothetical protein Mgra_00000337 [Meloidogyne graminicola]